LRGIKTHVIRVKKRKLVYMHVRTGRLPHHRQSGPVAVAAARRPECAYRRKDKAACLKSRRFGNPFVIIDLSAIGSTQGHAKARC
jgi:hypothetical protein